VSHTIGEHSTKRDRAIRFGRELDKAMKARDVGRRPLAQALRSSQTSIMYWRTGRMLPRLETARKLAAALDWPRIESLALELRQKRCQVDEVLFVDDSGSDNRVYCSPECQRVSEKLRMGSSIDKRAANAERRLTVHQRAIAAYCAGCEPEGRCVTPECALRPVSPLPLFAGRIEIAPVQSRQNGWLHSENRAAAASSAQKDIWARYTPEERQARIEKTAHASKVGRGLLPA